jgi:hypothetical protein
MVSSPKKTKTTRSHDQRVNGRGKVYTRGNNSVAVDTSSIGLGELQPDGAQRESVEGKYKKAPVRKLWKNHSERFADAIFNFRMDQMDPASLSADDRAKQYPGDPAGLFFFADTYNLPPTTLWRANNAFGRTLDASTVPWPWKKEQVLSWAKFYVSRHLPLELRKVDTGTNSCLIDVQNF